MKTEPKKKVMGMLTIGAHMFRNQLGVMGKNLRKSRKKNKLSWFSSTWEVKRRGCKMTFVGTAGYVTPLSDTITTTLL